MNDYLHIYTLPEFGQVRVLILDNEPWFVAVDICRILGYTNPREAVVDHVPAHFRQVINAKKLQQMASQSKGSNSLQKEQNATFAPQRHSSQAVTTVEDSFYFKGDETILLDFDSPRGLTFISVGGLLRLVIRSHMPNAERFTDYLCANILPSAYKNSANLNNTKPPAVKSQRAKALDLQRARLLKQLAACTPDTAKRAQLLAEAVAIVQDDLR